jgi:orotidine-5'-phosphate decarboxylase
MAEIVVALDLASTRQALTLVDSLPRLRWVKVGPTLFIEGGPELLRELKARGLLVFLDLKWHDIPHQVAGAAAAAAAGGVDLATVHTLGGVEMLRAAAAAAKPMRLVGVTVLTSHTRSSYAAAVGKSGEGDLRAEVLYLTGQAVEAGLDGIVASPLEISVVRPLLRAGSLIVVPGIRPVGADAGDQRRTAEPEVAIRAGATHLVVGRPITQAREPRAVFEVLCEAAT